MVIIIAAAAFVLLNIILWTIIASKHRRSAETPQDQQLPINPEDGTIFVQQPLEEDHKSRKASRRSAPQPESPDAFQRERVMREDFRLIDNIIVVHTSERL